MNKQTFYIITAFLVGIILTQYFAKNKETIIIQSTKNEELTPIQPKPSVMNKIALIKDDTKKIDTAKTPPNPQAIQNLEKLLKEEREKSAATAEAKTKEKRQVELILDDSGLQKLEQNINDLSVKVSMKKEDRGWRVSYLVPNNPMAQIGIMNNDLILYDLIESARQNPRTEKFIARLETIFYTLQK